jgi:hypothetical protein
VTGKGQNQSSYQRMRQKKAQIRRRHVDKYAQHASGNEAKDIRPETDDE